MYSNLTSYWTMMANNGYYLYMLNKYETFMLDKKRIVKDLLTKWKIQYRLYHYLGKNMKTCNKLSHIILKDMSCIFLIVFF